MPHLSRRAATTVLALILAVALSATAARAADTKIGPMGQVIVDGQPRIPLAVWTQPTYLFEYYRQLGINCIISPNEEGRHDEFRRSFDGVFKSAVENGLAVVTSRVGPDDDTTPLWGRMVGVMTPGQLDRQKAEFDRTRRRDPNRLILTNIDVHRFIDGQDADFYRQALLSTDAVICHVWPEWNGLDKRDLRNVATFVDRVRALCKDRPGGEVSIWPDINPHAWHGKNSGGGVNYPAPTERELRFQIWLALIHGADGVCFFPISFDPFVYSQIPAKNEQELARNTRLIDRLAPVLASDESTLPLTLASDLADGLLDSATRQRDGHHWIFLLNGEGRPQTVTLSLPGLGSKWRLRDAVSGKDISSAANGTFADRLDGLALRIWELVPVDAPQPAATSAASATPSEPKE